MGNLEGPSSISFNGRQELTVQSSALDIEQEGAGEVTQRVRVFPYEPEDLESILATLGKVEREDGLLTPHTPTAHLPPPSHIIHAQ